MHLYMHPSIYLSNLFIHPSIQPSIHLLTYLSTYLPIYLSISIIFSVDVTLYNVEINQWLFLILGFNVRF